MEKLDAELVFKLLDGFGYGGPLKSKAFCGGGEAASVNDFDEHFHGLQHVHDGCLCASDAAVRRFE
ncbi:hypothetical protein D3C86_1561010 [compost metagenome]